MIENYQRKVYYYETDRMGIVHHSNYIRWFEEARVFFFDQIGLNYDKLEKMGLWLPLIDSHCNYKSFMQYDQQFSIKTSITQYNGCKIRLSYIVYNEEGKIAADGYTTHCFTTPEMKILRVNKTNPQIHEKIASLVSD